MSRPVCRLYVTTLAVALVSLVPGSELVASTRSGSAESIDGMPAPGERALEGRLLAPCCWDQTLDVHESELARELRHEIRRRLRSGETPELVERDLVQRYGERLRAVRSPGPLSAVAAGMMLAIALAALGVLSLLRKWRRAGDLAARQDSFATVERDVYDDRLDEELRELDT